MKSRIHLYALIGLIIIALSGLWLFFSLNNDQRSSPVFAATINHDCAPWDGAAFTVSINYEFGSVIDISIWQSPAVILPMTFSFPDQTGQIGNASYHPALGAPEQLTGFIFFTRVDESHPVEGTFNFTTESGQQFKGRFKANWGTMVVMCG